MKSLSLKNVTFGILALIIVGVLVWQGVSANGAPDPSASNITPTTAILNTAILVFREGLEAILVLSAITAGLVRSKKDSWKPIFVGSGISFFLTIVTWFVVVGIISLVGNTTSELNIQAATGLLANIVLLIIMNWFFHKLYWTGWISLHNKKRRQITDAPVEVNVSASTSYWSLVVVGLTSVYREGFEVVLFLQNLRLQAGNHVILLGALIGLFFTGIVALLTFVAHQKLPYKKMLILTGALLVLVLLVMIGETAQEMQLAGWIPTTELNLDIPEWMGVWFSVFPTVETLAAQAFAFVFVVGSYVLLQFIRVWKPKLAEKLSS
ncbi:FTR1 family protein [Paenibacillus filicis]|uniref:FTR1 family protein n=1 Tax=Paenibacillus gyeongsangnamensis TaxID=3388067 RepID=A0ABT4Q4N7_9BACL|nr:FTR1 family protein [Paenibacillus filicis]MCZ8511849.1 FTR1 family protein [Paenibacillus filicis]